MLKKFLHLRVQSSYSMLESALKIEDITHLARENTMPAVALTDRNNLFGALEFSQNALKLGIQPINGMIIKVKHEGDQSINEKQALGEVLILAKDQIGYKNLLRLGSYLYMLGNGEYITSAELYNHHEGLIILMSYKQSIIGKKISESRILEAETWLKKYADIFGDRLYFELMRCKSNMDLKFEHEYLNLADKFGIPIVATNQVLFAEKKIYKYYNILKQISKSSESGGEEIEREFYFKTQEEMEELFSDLPAALENTINIARRCSVSAETSEPLLPSFTNNKISEEEELRNTAKNGLDRRLKEKFLNEITLLSSSDEEKAAITEQYSKRLEYELGVICSMKFAGYFLVVSDFIKWAKENKIPVGPGRGSGAGSIVAWSLLITDIDPLRFGLLFERFLNPERISMPDFDIDFCQERRFEVINYVRKKYGEDKVAQIITFGKLQARAVIKDVARVFYLNFELSNRLSKLIPFNAVNPVTLEQAVEEVAELKEAYKGNGLYNANLTEEQKETIKNVIDTALHLEGLHRHASVHAAGIVISGKDLIEIVPLYRDPGSDMNIIQYSMKYAELAGLVKFDFLGLKTLTVIDKCINLIEAQGLEVKLSNIDFSDAKTYQLLSKGLSVGIFQFESAGMKDSLRKLRPDCIEDLMALGALYRPGPMDNIPQYIACKHGLVKPDYLHPLLESTLKETYGVIIYQEQVLEIAKVLAGYSLGSADFLRRAMGKKIKSEMEAQQQQFIKGAANMGIEPRIAESIFALVAKFAGYGFNKAHAASYAAISYHTAFLKANFPMEFLVSTLNLDLNDTNKISLIIQDAKSLNIKILPPNINESESIFKIHYDNGEKVILFGLAALRSVGTGLINNIVKERSEHGKFKDIFDFAERIKEKDLNKRALESLIKAGSFDCLYANRKELYTNIERVTEYAHQFHRDREAKQISLFDSVTNASSKYPIFEKSEDFSQSIKIFKEFEAMGFFFSFHPLDRYSEDIEKIGAHNSSYLNESLEDGVHHIKLAAVVNDKESKMSPRGRYIILQLSDPYGIYEATIFNEEILKNSSTLLEFTGKDTIKLGEKNEELLPLLLITCEIRKDEGGIRITALKLEKLLEVLSKNHYKYSIQVGTTENLKGLLQLLKEKENITGNIHLDLVLNLNVCFNAKINLNHKFSLYKDDIERIKTYGTLIEQ